MNRDWNSWLYEAMDEIARINIDEGMSEGDAYDISGNELYYMMLDHGCPEEEAKSCIVNMGLSVE